MEAYRNHGFDAENGIREEEGSWAREVSQTKYSPKERGLGEVEEAHPPVSKREEDGEAVTVLGSGDFGRALAGTLRRAGCRVTLASREPERNRALCPEGVLLRGLDSLASASIVVVAVPRDFYHTLPAHLLAGKILVDVSNRSTTRRGADGVSQAEYLASLFPTATVVKAFNVLSAYSLESGGLQGSKQVPIAGETRASRERVASLVTAAGFTPLDLGELQAARTIEDIPVAVFPAWRAPLKVHIGIFIFLYALSFAKFQICWPLTWSESFMWELWNHIPMDNVNKTLAIHALVTLAICYLPGVLAGWLQIYRGTKYSRFPRFLDSWLRMRKQLGLLMMFAASIHACLSVAYMSPRYQEIVYGQPTEVFVNVMEGEGWGPKTPSENKTSVKVYGSEKMDWRGECFLMAGVFGFALVCLLGISSLPSVTATLSWKEFAFVQSGLGWTAMVVLCAHDIFYGWPYLNGPSCYIPSGFQYALYVPGLTILLKLPLVLPPLSTHLDRIRAGYVRGSSASASANESPDV